jgi:hypothetical protein
VKSEKKKMTLQLIASKVSQFKTLTFCLKDLFGMKVRVFVQIRQRSRMKKTRLKKTGKKRQ